MKPLRREKFSSLSSPSTREENPSLRKVTHLYNMTPNTSIMKVVIFPKCPSIFVQLKYFSSNFILTCLWIDWSHIYLQTHTLDAVLLLLRDLDEEELRVVHTATQNRLQTFTVDSEMFNDSLQTEKAVHVQQWNAVTRPNVWMICICWHWSCFGYFLLLWRAQMWSCFRIYLCPDLDLNLVTHQPTWWGPARYKVATL